MPLADGLIFELDQEAKTTKRLLERVPQEHLGWKPHEKSMSLGQLAFHVARIPGTAANLLMQDGMDAKKVNFTPPAPESKQQILEVLESGVMNARNILSDLTSEKAMESWRLSAGDREVFSVPRIGVARNIMLNHWYHHRGQLTVYLRLLNVPLPVTYGRSADENPFA